MITAADGPSARSAEAKLLVLERGGRIRHEPRGALVEVLQPGDLVVANDAATLPASLLGRHVPSGRVIEVRLAGRRSLVTEDVREFTAVVFGEGDFHVRTELRPPPPALGPGDRLALGPLSATVLGMLGHPRLVQLRFDGSPDEVWAGLARHGRPIQYAHVQEPLALWDVWTAIAGPPVAFEPPSAGFVLDWHLLQALRDRRIGFATLTHAAGISSTGDETLDARLPLDEPYAIPEATANDVNRARLAGRRIVAIGTTVVRALEHATGRGRAVAAGPGVADQRLGPTSQLHVVDAILTGVHEPGSSHYELLRAFTPDATFRRLNDALAVGGYRAHEFGDSVFIEAA